MPLELNDQLILGGLRFEARDEDGLDSVAGRVPRSTESDRHTCDSVVRRVDEDHLNLPLGREVSYPFKTWSLRVSRHYAFVFETHSLGTSNSWVFANSISAAVWLAIVVFLALLLPTILVRILPPSLHERFPLFGCGANEALSSGHQNVVRLRELTLAQAIKQHSRDLLEVSDAVRAAQPCLLGRRERRPSARVTDRSDSQTVALRISAQQTHSGRRELQGYGYGNASTISTGLGRDVRPPQGYRYALPQRQIELVARDLRSSDNSMSRSRSWVSGVQLSSLVCLGRSGHP